MKNQMKGKKGITLIALVISILVILILAGVTIATLTGDNGLLTKASDAKNKTGEATAKEKVQLAWSSAYTEYLENYYKSSNVNKDSYLSVNNVNKHLDENDRPITSITKENDNYIIEYKGYTFSINEGGRIGTVTKGNSAEIAAVSDNIGKSVNYGVSYTGTGSGWQILYADENNVFLITKGYLTPRRFSNNERDAYSGTVEFSDLTKYPAVADGWLYKIYGQNFSSSKTNMRLTAFLLDSTNLNWSQFNNNYSKWVIGGPTLEMLVASYNATISENNKVTIENLNSNGYPYTFNSTTPLPNENNGATRPWNIENGYWLAGPGNKYEHCILCNTTTGTTGEHPWDAGLAFRPVVCLKSNVSLRWNESTSEYDLESSVKY